MREIDYDAIVRKHLAALGLSAPLAHPILLLQRARVAVALQGRSSDSAAVEVSVAQPRTVAWQLLMGYARRQVATAAQAYALACAYARHCDARLWLANDAGFPVAHSRPRLRLVR